MGLFDKVFGGSQPEKLNAQEAFTGILFATVASDGSISQEEMLSIVTILNRMKLYQGLNEKQMRAVLDKVMNILKKQGAAPIIAAAKETLQPEMKETAFAVAADLMLADGTVADEEKKLLEELQKALEIPDAQALKITEVLVIKNRG